MAADSEGTGLASSLTDLMTSLAVIFILLLVASYNDGQEEFDAKSRGLATKENELERTKSKLRAAEDELEKAKERTDVTRNQILLTLQKELESFRAEGVRAETDPRDPLVLLVIVPEDLLKFAKNEDKIPEGGDKFLRRFTPVLARTVCSDKFEKEISAIVVEGHTDSSGPPAISLPLSQRRSMTVVQKSLNVLSEAMADSRVPFTILGCYLRFLSASGRGSSEIIKNETTGKEDMDRSRRVEFKIRVRSLEQRQQMQETLGSDTSPKAVEIR
jgi:outer membrane protein OmpA-like peptidoglycan-associated protein